MPLVPSSRVRNTDIPKDSDEAPGQIPLACTPTPLMHLDLEKEESVPMEQEPIGV